MTAIANTEDELNPPDQVIEDRQGQREIVDHFDYNSDSHEEDEYHGDHPHRRKCDPCLGHKLIEERTKLIDSIPGLLDFRASVKGGLVVGALVALFIIGTGFTMIGSASSEMKEKQSKQEIALDARMQKHEDSISKSTDKQQRQITEMLNITNALASTVETFIATQKLMQVQAERERDRLAKRMDNYEDEQRGKGQ